MLGKGCMEKTLKKSDFPSDSNTVKEIQALGIVEMKLDNVLPGKYYSGKSSSGSIILVVSYFLRF